MSKYDLAMTAGKPGVSEGELMSWCRPGVRSWKWQAEGKNTQHNSCGYEVYYYCKYVSHYCRRLTEHIHTFMSPVLTTIDAHVYCWYPGPYLFFLHLFYMQPLFINSHLISQPTSDLVSSTPHRSVSLPVGESSAPRQWAAGPGDRAHILPPDPLVLLW